MKIAAIVLAAGRSSRFEGGHKLLAPIGGHALIHAVMSAVDAAPVDDIILVTAPESGQIISAAGPGRWRIVANEAAADGLSSSIRAGLSSLERNTDGALIVLADMPRVTCRLIAKLIGAFDESCGEAIVFPQTRNGQQGHPVLWPRSLFAELIGLSGDVGGKAILSRHRHLCRPVFADGNAAIFDIDTRADLDIARQ